MNVFLKLIEHRSQGKELKALHTAAWYAYLLWICSHSSLFTFTDVIWYMLELNGSPFIHGVF